MSFTRIVTALLVCVCLGLAACGGTAAEPKNADSRQETLGGSTMAEDKTAEKTPIDVYLLAGQSNMAGTSRRSYLPEQYQRSYPNVKMYMEVGGGIASDFHRWITVKPNQGASGQGFGDMFGPELGMAEVLQNKNTEIAFIKYAYGGTAIYQNEDVNNKPGNYNNWHGRWDNAIPGKLYTDFIDIVYEGIEKLEDDGYAPTIRGMAWMQGETDGEIQFNNEKHNAADLYEHNLTEFFKAVRAEFDVSAMPIVFGEIYEYSFSVIQARKIVLTQKKVGQMPNNYFVDTGDLTLDGSIDTWHWNGISEWFLGVRFGEKLYEAVHGPFDNAFIDGAEGQL